MKGKLLVAFIALLLAAVLAISLAGRQLGLPGPLTTEATVLIPAGSSTRAVATTLAERGIITSPRLFELWARATGLARTFQAGEYRFEAAIPMRAVMNKLALGKVAQRGVTIPEGYTVRQMLTVLGKTDGLTGEARPIPAEGMFFPDTYHFTTGTARVDILKQAQARMEETLTQAWNARDVTLPYKEPTDLLIMASIVQKEAASDDEMPTIAGVFVNRLRKGMRLESDPTVMYGADITNNDLRKKHMTEPTPFNTYLNTGLPPTPIANPGHAALMAAARPAPTDALFFVAKPDKSGHVFSATYAEHQRNVKAYWEGQK